MIKAHIFVIVLAIVQKEVDRHEGEVVRESKVAQENFLKLGIALVINEVIRKKEVKDLNEVVLEIENIKAINEDLREEIRLNIKKNPGTIVHRHLVHVLQ